MALKTDPSTGPPQPPIAQALALNDLDEPNDSTPEHIHQQQPIPSFCPPNVPSSNSVPEDAPEQKKATEPSNGNYIGKKFLESWNVTSPCVITAVLYKEAALDSPSFRASMNHLDSQLNYVDKWLESFTKSLSKLSAEMDSLQEHANSLISKFVPSFVTQGVIDHDYTMLAMRRYAEISSYFWTSIIRKVKSHHLRIIEELSGFQKGDLKKYKDTRKIFDNAQVRYDSMLAKYLSQSKNKEPSALREDAFQLAEARSSYFKTCFQLANTLSTTQTRLDICLVKAMADPWILSPSEFSHSDPVFQKVSVEMTRLKSWAKSMQKDFKPFLKQLSTSSKEIEQQAVEKFVPSRYLNEYSVTQASLSRFVPDDNPNRKPQDEKHGWVFVRSASKTRVTWVKRWIFVKNNMFGWLNISPSGTFVQESDKVGVLLCHVTPISTEDRRFCFEIKTKDIIFVIQAETRNELISWLQVFEDSKRAAVESGESKINLAFQRIPPAISEFASTANASVDVELHEALESPSMPQFDFTSKSLTGNSTTDSMREMMTAGETLTRDKRQKKVNFITVGPFGSSLVSSPLINAPMPTSKTLDAVLASSLLSSTTLPTAVTANYWGSINWIAYDAEQNPNEVHVTSAGDSLVKPERKLSAIFVDRYPEYYPLELRSQDAQLRAIFQPLISDSDSDRVVMAFRCLARPNPNYEVTCRVFLTPSHMFLYSHSVGFTISAICPLKDLISVESRQALNCDNLYFIGKTGTGQCRVFLDSGRLVQKRMLFLIDNLHSANPLGLKEIIEKLQDIGHEQHEDQLDELLSLEKEHPSTIDDIQYAQEVGQRYETQLRQFYDRESPLKVSESSSTLPNSITDDPKLRFLSSKAKSAEFPHKRLTKSYTLLGDDEYVGVIYSELRQSMAQLSAEYDFDIPAKALFHVMFGENSDVFLYSNSVMVIRDKVSITPWKLVGSARMEREINFNIGSIISFSGEIQDRVMTMQRVERMNDRCYMVYERRAIWTLPQGSFYTTGRYVILKTSKNTCKLSIWNSVEWIKSSFIKNITEPYVLGKFKDEATMIVNRVLKCRQRLGAKGSTMTAIRMFGKLGTSWDENSFDSKRLDRGSIKELDQLESNDLAQTQVVLSQKSALKSLFEIIFSILVSFVGEVFLVSRRVLSSVWNGILTNKVLVVALILSLFFNTFYGGRSVLQYWEAKFTVSQATKAISDFELIPTDNNILKRSIFLSQLDELIRNGTSFSKLSHHSSEWREMHNSKIFGSDKNETGSKPFDYFNITGIWTTPNETDPARATLCYDRFRNLALEDGDFDSIFVERTDNILSAQALSSSAALVSAVRNRIHGFRSRIGIARNQLIIELRTLNRLEKELVMAEWQAWLFDEVSMCTRLVDAMVYNSSPLVSGKGLRADDDDSQTAGQNKLFGDRPVRVRKALTYYCASCVAENKALREFNLFEPNY